MRLKHIDRQEIDIEIRKVRKQGDSTIIAITGFAKVGEHYKIEKKDEKTIVLTKVE